MSSGRTKTWIGNLFALGASLLLSALLLEQGFRFALFGWNSFSVGQMNSLHNIGVSGLLKASPYPDLIYELKPDLRTTFKLTPLSTNSQGLRDREYDLKKPAGAFRIAVVGDSFSLPSGVAIEEAYHSLLEERLNHEISGARYEILNFAVSGYNLRQYLAVVEHKCSLYDPDLILVAYCSQNDHKPQKWKFDQEYQPKAIEHSFYRSFALRALRSIDGFKIASHNNDVAFIRELKKPRHRRYLTKYLGKLAEFSQTHGTPVLVVQLDNWWTQVPFLEQQLAELGLPFVNATVVFRDRKIGDYVHHPLDRHPNSAAQKLFAEEIYGPLVAMAQR